MKKISMLLVFLIGVLALSGAAHAAAVPITIDEVKVDGTVVTTGATTRLDLERGQTIPVKVKITANENVDETQIEAFISGYEYSDIEPISDSTKVFSAEANVTYVKTLNLKLPDRAEEDDYLLRVIVTNRNDDEIIRNYRIKMDVPRHNVAIRDVVFSPEGSVEAGRALLATVRIKNMGEKDEEGIKVKVSVPDLGISAADYVDTLESDESTTSEELYLRVPQCAKAGDYTTKVEVEYNEGTQKVSKSANIEVTSGELCEVPSTKPSADTTAAKKTVITLSTTSQEMSPGQKGAVYPVTITNANSHSRSYMLSVEGTQGWATTEISPSNTLVLAGSESGTMYVYVTANKDAAAGERMFIAKVKSGEETLKEIGLKANVKEAAASNWSKLKTALEVAVAILVVLLVILGLVIGFSKLKGEKEEEAGEAGQTYY